MLTLRLVNKSYRFGAFFTKKYSFCFLFICESICYGIHIHNVCSLKREKKTILLLSEALWFVSCFTLLLFHI